MLFLTVNILLSTKALMVSITMLLTVVFQFLMIIAILVIYITGDVAVVDKYVVVDVDDTDDSCVVVAVSLESVVEASV